MSSAAFAGLQSPSFLLMQILLLPPLSCLKHDMPRTVSTEITIHNQPVYYYCDFAFKYQATPSEDNLSRRQRMGTLTHALNYHILLPGMAVVAGKKKKNDF